MDPYDIQLTYEQRAEARRRIRKQKLEAQVSEASPYKLVATSEVPGHYMFRLTLDATVGLNNFVCLCDD